MAKIPFFGGSDEAPKNQNPGDKPPDEQPPADQAGGGEDNPPDEQPPADQAGGGESGTQDEPEAEPETAAEKNKRLRGIRKEIAAINKKTKSGAFGKGDIERRRFLEAELEK